MPSRRSRVYYGNIWSSSIWKTEINPRTFNVAIDEGNSITKGSYPWGKLYSIVDVFVKCSVKVYRILGLVKKFNVISHYVTHVRKKYIFISLEGDSVINIVTVIYFLVFVNNLLYGYEFQSPFVLWLLHYADLHLPIHIYLARRVILPITQPTHMKHQSSWKN